MTLGRRVALVTLGYLAAFAVASIVLTLYVAFTTTPDRQSSMGMYAFGDTIVFLGVLGLASLPPAGAVLYFLRDNRQFWIALATVSLMVATTGIASVIAYCTSYDNSPSWLRMFALVFSLRVLAAPLLALAFLLSGLLAPPRLPRLALFTATAVEAALFIAVASQWFGKGIVEGIRASLAFQLFGK